MLYEVITTQIPGTAYRRHGTGLSSRPQEEIIHWLNTRITSYNVCYTKLLRHNGKLARNANREKYLAEIAEKDT